MIIPCVNCRSISEVEADGIYIGYVKCGECGFIKSKMVEKYNVILPSDPNDEVMCESCQ